MGVIPFPVPNLPELVHLLVVTTLLNHAVEYLIIIIEVLQILIQLIFRFVKLLGGSITLSQDPTYILFDRIGVKTGFQAVTVHGRTN